MVFCILLFRLTVLAGVMNLSDHPNEIVGTSNDDEAKAFLAELGVLEKMQNQRVAPGRFSNQLVRLDIWNHPTHWITALKVDGSDRPEECGYVVRCLPKSRLTLAQAKLQFEAEKKEDFPDGAPEFGEPPPG